ncbi:hypothetical protein BD309DRAFT_964136 [Dichomitus squalens]|uniref:Uncharacterized protein n=1 Tax=Dichomitus squalens TaxID=114155 RepID=A0A4Q9NMT4_9APHY|nr:hypothetical protein BD309DRAFT_964136 [Dichomitus squalens]TBU59638.1 hypothetical protein BD310DRAFT_386145 [Dichomitus squalens]
MPASALSLQCSFMLVPSTTPSVFIDISTNRLLYFSCTHLTSSASHRLSCASPLSIPGVDRSCPVLIETICGEGSECRRARQKASPSHIPRSFY